MEIPADQAKAFYDAIADFAVRLKAVEFMVQKLSTDEGYRAALNKATQAVPRDAFAQAPRVEYVDILGPLTAIYKSLQ